MKITADDRLLAVFGPEDLAAALEDAGGDPAWSAALARAAERERRQTARVLRAIYPDADHAEVAF